MFELMFPALVASLVILSIHGYLGIHIIARGVIFVDLALAQVAALGWAAAGLGLDHWLHEVIGIPEAVAAYTVGLVFTLFAAALISVSRTGHKFVPHEAIIGIIYVVATAGTILVAAQAPRGSEHVEQLLTGTLLWVTWPEIMRTAAIYIVIGAIHFALRKRFFLISLDPDAAKADIRSIRKWDFLFYALFGVVVTQSVAIGGVLVVFSFLVIPAVIAFLFTESPPKLLAIAWGSGTIAVILGLIVSFKSDLPTGPVIVCAFGLVLIAAFGLRALLPGPHHDEMS
jgi:zinc/manganese transport system permease protein